MCSLRLHETKAHDQPSLPATPSYRPARQAVANCRGLLIKAALFLCGALICAHPPPAPEVPLSLYVSSVHTYSPASLSNNACERSLSSHLLPPSPTLCRLLVRLCLTTPTLHPLLYTVALLIVPLVSEASSRSLLLVRISCSRPHPSFSASFSVPSKMPMVHMDIDGARRVKKLSPNLAGGSCYSDNEKNIQENGTSESGRNAGLAITQGQVYPALSQSH